MDVIEAIKRRKSTRNFNGDKIQRSQIEEIIRCGMQAPSPKNDQPWRFCIIESEASKNVIANILSNALKTLEEKSRQNGIKRSDISEAFCSVDIMRSAAVLIFVFLDDTAYSKHDDGMKWNLDASDIECTHIQAIGASIQNMLLAATDMEIDSLWLGDIFYAYNDLVELLKEKGCLMAAVALGHGRALGQKTSRQSLHGKVHWFDKN